MGYFSLLIWITQALVHAITHLRTGECGRICPVWLRMREIGMLDAGDRLVLIECKDMISQDNHFNIRSCGWELQRAKWISCYLHVFPWRTPFPSPHACAQPLGGRLGLENCEWATWMPQLSNVLCASNSHTHTHSLLSLSPSLPPPLCVLTGICTGRIIMLPLSIQRCLPQFSVLLHLINLPELTVSSSV